MKNVAKLGLFVLFGVFLFLVSISFPFKGLSERVIVLGVGIDFYPETDEYEVSAEVIVPGGGSSDSSAGTDNGIVSGRGETVSYAITDIYQKYGKTPSLGECSIIVIGEEAAKNTDLRQTLGYFYTSDAFKDATLTVVCEGKAKELFQIKTTMENYITFSLLSIVQSNGNATTIPFEKLSSAIEKQGTPSQACYMSFVKTVQTEIEAKDQNGGETTENESKLDVKSLCVFKSNAFAGVLSEDAVRGLCLATQPKIFDTFVVEQQTDNFYMPPKTSFGIIKKSCGIDVELKDGKAVATVDVKVRLKRMRTDTLGEVLGIQQKDKIELKEDGLKQVEEKMKTLIGTTLQEALTLDSDFLGVSDEFYRKYGKEWEKFKGDKSVFDVVEFKIKTKATN